MLFFHQNILNLDIEVVNSKAFSLTFFETISTLIQITKVTMEWTLNQVIGKSLSEVLILISIIPQYDNTLFIKLRVQYKKATSSVLVGYVFGFFDIENNCSFLVLNSQFNEH